MQEGRGPTGLRPISGRLLDSVILQSPAGRLSPTSPSGLYPRRACFNSSDIEPLGWRREIRDRIAELESHRLRLEEARVRASDEGTDEGDHLEAELRVELQKISEQINDLRASLE